MSTEPSIKGYALSSVIDDLRRLLEEGRLSHAKLEQTLSAEARSLLGSEISNALWYPIAPYGEMLDLLLEIEGLGSEEYLRGRGKRTFERFRALGLYQQLDFLQRNASEQVTREDVMRAIKMGFTLYSTVYNFGRYQVEVDPENQDQVRQIIYEAGPLPDSALPIIAGFCTESLCLLAGGRKIMSVEAHRSGPDTVEFSLDLTPILSDLD
jgi:hypothetical protein